MDIAGSTESLKQDGFVIIKSCFEPSQICDMKQSCVQLFNHSDSGVEVYFIDQCPDWLRAACCSRNLAGLLERLQITAPEFLSVKTVMKNADCQFASPWHQDRPYWGGTDKYSLWVALDDCSPENGCLRVIPGTHGAGEWAHEHPDDWKFNNRLNPALIDESLAVNVELQAGDAVLFHDCLVHASYPNISGRDRWSMIATYRSSDIPDPSTCWSRAYPMTASSAC